jgi:hypothetical protein
MPLAEQVLLDPRRVYDGQSFVLTGGGKVKVAPQ